MLITKEEDYLICKVENGHFSADHAGKFEKAVASAYGSDGMINYIADLSLVKTMDPEGLSLFQKIHRISTKEGGLFIIVNDHDPLLDYIAAESVATIPMIATLEDAIEAIYMNESNSEFDEGEDDEFGYNESDY